MSYPSTGGLERRKGLDFAAELDKSTVLRPLARLHGDAVTCFSCRMTLHYGAAVLTNTLQILRIGTILTRGSNVRTVDFHVNRAQL